MVSRTWRLVVALMAGALILASPVLAADPDYLPDMPSAEEINAVTAGSDPFDTAARQTVAFDRMYELSVALIGDRFLAGEMTPAERTVRDTYLGNRDRVLRELQASLPADQREFKPNTRFAEWRALVDVYRADTAFSEQLFEAVLPTTFRTTHAAILADVIEEGAVPYGPPPVALAPGATSSQGAQTSILAIVAVLAAGVALPIVLKRGRMRLDSKDVFRMYLGNGGYTLHHATGLVEGSSKMGTTNVYGGGGGGSGGSSAPISIGSSTTIHDQFFLRLADGRVESIQLAGWNFPVMDGHLVSAVWAVRDGANKGSYVVLRNHTTRDSSAGSAFLTSKMMRADGFAIILLETALCVGIGFVAAPILGLPLAIGAAIVGAFLGSVVWHVAIKPRFIKGFYRGGLPRIHSALDGVAATSTSA